MADETARSNRLLHALGRPCAAEFGAPVCGWPAGLLHARERSLAQIGCTIGTNSVAEPRLGNAPRIEVVGRTRAAATHNHIAGAVPSAILIAA